MSAPREYPSGLHAAGRRAWDRAVGGLTAPEREAFADVAERFARQVDVADALRREWVRLKRPMLGRGERGGDAAHPLIREMRQADALVARLARELRLTPAAVHVGIPGRKPGDRTPDKVSPHAPMPAPPKIRRVA